LQSSISLSTFPHTQLSSYTVNVDSSARCLYNLFPNYLQDVIIESTVKGKLAFEFAYDARDQSTGARLNLHLSDVQAALRSGDSLSIHDLNASYFLRDDSSAFSFSMPEASLGENYASVVFNISPPRAQTARVYLNIELKKLAHSLGMPSVDRLSGSIRARYSFMYDSQRNRTRADGLITFADALVQRPIGIDTLYTGECDGSISLKNNRLSFNKLLLRLGASDAVLTGTLVDYQNIFLRHGASLPSMRLSIASRVFSTIGLLPHMNLNIGRQTLAWFPKASVSMNFNIGRFVMPQETLNRLSGNLQIQDYFVRFNSLRYESRVGTFSVSGWADYGQEGKMIFGVRALVSTPNFAQLFSRYTGGRELASGGGKGSIALNGACDDSGKIDLAGLGGRGRFAISNLELKDYSVLNSLYRFLGAEGRDSLKINSASFGFDVANGRVYFSKMIAYGTPLDFRLDGWQGFDGTLDYKLNLRIYPPLSLQIVDHVKPSYPELAPTPDGILGISLVAGGTTTDARFTIFGFNTRLAFAPSLPPSHLYSSLR